MYLELKPAGFRDLHVCDRSLHGAPAWTLLRLPVQPFTARYFMGVLDKLFGNDSEKDKKATADFSDVRSGSSSTAAFNRTYTVVAGDSLSKIAKREYGDASKWHRIFEANRDKIQNPDLIQPGQVLNLPQG
jgi:LysM domain